MSTPPVKAVIAEEKNEDVQKHFSYQRVDGLEKIYVGLGEVPEASFVFATAEKARICAAAVISEGVLAI